MRNIQTRIHAFEKKGLGGRSRRFNTHYDRPLPLMNHSRRSVVAVAFSPPPAPRASTVAELSSQSCRNPSATRICYICNAAAEPPPTTPHLVFLAQSAQPRRREQKTQHTGGRAAHV